MDPSNSNIVLLVDAASESLDAVTAVLRQKHFQVIDEAAPREGYECALRKLPDLIIGSLSPEKRNIELCRLIRADKRLKDTPILLITALKNSESVIEAMLAGADDYLEMPYEPEFLLAKVSNLIRRKQGLDEIKKLCSILERQIAELEDANKFLRQDLKALRLIEKHYQLQQKILLEVNEADDFHSSLGVFLRHICEITGWVYAEAWVPRSDESHLEPSPFWFASVDGLEKFREISEKLTFKPNVGLPGLAWAEKRLIWMQDILENTEFRRRPIAAEVGFKTALAFPVLSSEKVVAVFAVLEFFNDRNHPQDKRIISLMSLAAPQLGAVIERKRAEDALRISESQYRFLADSVPQQVWTATPEGVTDYVNKYILDYTDLTFGQALGSAWLDSVHPDDLLLNKELWDHSIKTGEPLEMELRLKCATDQSYRWHVSRARAMLNENGKIIKWFGSNTDIDDYKLMIIKLQERDEQLRQAQKLEAVGFLAGGIAHDFNNMLTAINGYSELLLKQIEEGSELRPKVEEIKKAGDRAASLTHQLLAFSRRQMLQPKVVDLNTVISEMKAMLQRMIGEDIQIVSVPDPGLEKIYADPGQIAQVVMNLVINARDAMPTGGKVTIETTNVFLDEEYARRDLSVEPGDYIMLAVSDSGDGMSAEVQKHIFEPFFTTKELGRGTGLGLATIYGIVKQSGGSIRVYSEVDQGTTFKIYFPRHEVEPEAVPDESDQTFRYEGTETILLVEDEDVVRGLTREILEMCGYRVIEAATVTEAIAISRKAELNIDLLITDVVMPEMGGRDLSERLLVERPALRVLYMSGYTPDAIIHHGVIDEGIDFIQKPFTLDDLAGKVREVLDCVTGD